jgi:hypothetical protein
MPDERQEEVRPNDPFLPIPYIRKTDSIHDAAPPANYPLGYSLDVLDAILDP